MPLFVPEIVDGEIKTGKKLNTVFLPTANIKYDLEGQPGDTVTFLTYSFIGDAQELGADEVLVPTSLSHTSAQAVIKELGKAVEVKYRDQLQAQGDAVNEATRQLKIVLAEAADKALYVEYLTSPNVYDAHTNTDTANQGFTFNTILKASAMLKHEGEEVEAFAFVHPNQVADVIESKGFIDFATYANNAGANINPKITASEIGKISTVRIIKTNAIEQDVTDPANPFYKNVLVVKGAGQIRFQQSAMVEDDKDILARKLVLAGTEYFAAKLVDQGKVVVINAK